MLLEHRVHYRYCRSIQALPEAVAAPDIPARKAQAITLHPILSLTGGLEHFKGRRTLWDLLPLTTFHRLKVLGTLLVTFDDITSNGNARNKRQRNICYCAFSFSILVHIAIHSSWLMLSLVSTTVAQQRQHLLL
jgi:hypothetical protein